MRRRTALRGLGGLVLAPAVLGCTTVRSGENPEQGIAVVETAGEARGSATIDVAVRVQNRGDHRETATVWAEVAIFSGGTYRDHQDVTVPGNETRVLEFAFEIDEGEAQWGGQYSYRAWVE